MPTIPERMSRLEEKTDNLVAGQKAMVNQVAQLDVKVDKKFDELMENLDKRYASKLTERIVYGTAGVILLSFLGILLALAWPKKPTTITNTITTQQPGETNSGGGTTTTTQPGTNNNTSTTTTTTQPGGSTSPVDSVKSIFGLK